MVFNPLHMFISLIFVGPFDWQTTELSGTVSETLQTSKAFLMFSFLGSCLVTNTTGWGCGWGGQEGLVTPFSAKFSAIMVMGRSWVLSPARFISNCHLPSMD